MSRRRHRRAVTTTVLLGLGACLTLGGCGVASEASQPAVEVVDAFTAEGEEAVAVYLEVRNRGGADSIVGAVATGPPSLADAKVTLHQTTTRDGLSIMEPTDAIEVEADAEDALAAADAHIMITGFDTSLRAGVELGIRLDMRRGDDVSTDVRVLSADEATALLMGEQP